MWLTIPNLFTTVRILMTPFILIALAHGQSIFAGWLFGGAAFTDLLDGAVARRFGGESKVGQYLDPVADKILLSSTWIGLAAGHMVPVWIVVVIFCRDVWISLLSAIALRFTQFRGLQPSLWGKGSTFAQVIAAVTVMAAHGFGSAALESAAGSMIWLVAALAAISAADYSRRGIAYLRGLPATKTANR